MEGSFTSLPSPPMHLPLNPQPAEHAKSACFDNSEHYCFITCCRSRAALAKTLFDLEESGPTALGPALAVSVAMASVKNGSKVIVCTVRITSH